MSAEITSDKEISNLLRLAAAILESPDTFDAEETAALVESLDRAAEALDARRGVCNA